MDNLIQITSGRGPAECCWVVAKVVKEILKYIKKNNGEAEVIDRVKGTETNTLVSAVIKTSEIDKSLLDQWIGTILWIGKSPYRKFHKRKNWYIGVNYLDNNTNTYSSTDIIFQTLRSSGPGGQHVNKTESAVRAIHKPTGIFVLAQDSRSQHTNKQLAIERLQIKLKQHEHEEQIRFIQNNWNNHNSLERGNPVKVFEGNKFSFKK